MKIHIDKQYFVKEYEKSYMFKLPEGTQYGDKVFFYSKDYSRATPEGYELSASDTFTFSLRDSKRGEQHVSAEQLRAVFEPIQDQTAWTIDREESDVVIAVGDETEEYVVGARSAFGDQQGILHLVDPKSVRRADTYNEAEFYFDTALEAISAGLTPKEEAAYQRYIDSSKKKGIELGIEDWYDMVESRGKWLENANQNMALDKMGNWKNDRMYERYLPYPLRGRKQFIVWKWDYDDEKQRLKKVPINPWHLTSGASSVNSFTWATFDKCCERERAYAEKYKLAGVGIMFGQGVMGIDFDHCIHDGVCDPAVKEIVEKIDSYTEYSPSGDGLHVLLFGHVPEGYKNRNDAKGAECYDHGRFFTITGKPFEGKIRTMKKAEITQPFVNEFAEKFLQKRVQGTAAKVGATLEDDRIIKLIRNSVKKDTFASLFDRGEVPIGRDGLLNKNCMKKKNSREQEPPMLVTNDEILRYYEKDNNRCDSLLCGIIASYTDDPNQMDRIFRQSALMRPKWDEDRGGVTYGQQLCAMALKTVQWKYNANRKPHARARDRHNTDVLE